MAEEIKLNDISDDLLILNKITIDTLFKLENCSDCIALYVFYYKTAKWQKTNTIKATDKYTRMCLNWSTNRILKIKTILKENGLIDVIQRRQDGKITGWYIQVNYLINAKKREEIKIKVEESKNLNIQELEISRTCNEETNALKEIIKCLKKEIEMLKNKERKTSFDLSIDNYTSDSEIQELLKEWLKVRKAKRSAMTDRAIQLNLNKLDKLAKESDMDVRTYLEEVISRGWAAFYKINDFSKKTNKVEGNKYENNRTSNKRDGSEYAEYD